MDTLFIIIRSIMNWHMQDGISSYHLRRPCALSQNSNKAHGHWYYIESIPLDNNGKELPGSKGAEGREFSVKR